MVSCGCCRGLAWLHVASSSVDTANVPLPIAFSLAVFPRRAALLQYRFSCFNAQGLDQVRNLI